MTSPLAAHAEYQGWLNNIKQRVVSARLRVALAANSELIALYYELGAQIVDREAHARWGSGFIDAFSKVLRQTFPEVGGFSSKNLRYCRTFFRFYCDPAIWMDEQVKVHLKPPHPSPLPVGEGVDVSLPARLSIWQQAVAILPDNTWVGVDETLAAQLARIPWGRHILIFTKYGSAEEASFYIAQTFEQGWSRDVLALQLKSKLHERAGKAVTNFSRTLPAPPIGPGPADAEGPLHLRLHGRQRVTHTGMTILKHDLSFINLYSTKDADHEVKT